MRKKVFIEIKGENDLPEHLKTAMASLDDCDLVYGETSSGLVFENGNLFYKDQELGNLLIDFQNDHVNYQRKAHRGKSELIAKAIGMPKGYKSVFDGTFGLGQDAFFLAQLGASVVGAERSPEVFLLLKDAIFRSEGISLEVYYGDAKDFFTSQKPSVIYLDPMFPHKKKSALPRKEMQIFRKLVGDDLDAQEVLMAALQNAKDRVVVKRPIKAEPLRPNPIHQFEGTTIRYDLYSPIK